MRRSLTFFGSLATQLHYTFLHKYVVILIILGKPTQIAMACSETNLAFPVARKIEHCAVSWDNQES